MGTKNFNFIDRLISRLRLQKISKYIKKDDIIFDFGSGNQLYFLDHIKDKIKYGVGLDYDMPNKHLAKNIKLIKYRFVKKLPLESGYFTKIFLLAILEHIDVKIVKTLFDELYRILMPTGKIILTTPTPFSKPVLEFLANRLHIISKEEINDHKKYYSKQNLIDIAKKAGLKFEEYRTFQFKLNSYAVLKK